MHKLTGRRKEGQNRNRQHVKYVQNKLNFTKQKQKNKQLIYTGQLMIHTNK